MSYTQFYPSAVYHLKQFSTWAHIPIASFIWLHLWEKSTMHQVDRHGLHNGQSRIFHILDYTQ